MSSNNTNSTNSTDATKENQINNLKLIIVIVIIIMCLFLCFFIYNLIKCYLPKFLKNADKDNNRYIDQKDESRIKNERGKIEFEEL